MTLFSFPQKKNSSATFQANISRAFNLLLRPQTALGTQNSTVRPPYGRHESKSMSRWSFSSQTQHPSPRSGFLRRAFSKDKVVSSDPRQIPTHSARILSPGEIFTTGISTRYSVTLRDSHFNATPLMEELRPFGRTDKQNYGQNSGYSPTPGDSFDGVDIWDSYFLGSARNVLFIFGSIRKTNLTLNKRQRHSNFQYRTSPFKRD